MCRWEEPGPLGIAFIDITDKFEERGKQKAAPDPFESNHVGLLRLRSTNQEGGTRATIPTGEEAHEWIQRCDWEVVLTTRDEGRLDRSCVTPAFVATWRHLKVARCKVSTQCRVDDWGHSAGNVHEQYIHKDTLPMSVLRDGLERLR